MSSDIPDKLRRLVSQRADNRCEYCLLPESAALHKHEPDHIVPHQHGGQTSVGNLALACLRCNRYKGPNVGSYDPATGQLVPLFNPRIHEWKDHFQFIGSIIHPLTPEARVTEKLLRFNEEHRIAERERLIEAGIYEQ